MTLLELDARSRVVIPGHAGEKFLMREQEDGTILLEPARVISQAQAEYDQTPELRDLLAQATRSATVTRPRRARRTT